ncbi:MAG TPA: DUF3788 family protein [Candidatus Limnocylindrales bacterium]|nr:DUF3788 family protein [Candidatus Limnocylindrales bacterium]
MNRQNAFVGKTLAPTMEETSKALGPSAKVWNQLVDWLAKEHDVAIQEWKCSSPKYGWSLRLKLKERTIVYLSPCTECFRVSFTLGDRAVKAALVSGLPKSVVALLKAAPRYAEGTGLRLEVRKAADLPPIRKLAEIKLAN